MSSQQAVIEQAGELFLRYGIRSVTMDDIANNLGISKKTLYQYVDNKSDLIHQIILAKKAEDHKTFEAIKSKSDNAIEEILSIATCMIKSLRQVSPAVMYDLQKYYKESWQEMEEMSKKDSYNLIKDNIERGKEQELYRSNVDADIIARLHVGSIVQIVQDDLFPMTEFPKDKILEQYITYHIYGVASKKGLALLEQLTLDDASSGTACPI